MRSGGGAGVKAKVKKPKGETFTVFIIMKPPYFKLFLAPNAKLMNATATLVSLQLNLKLLSLQGNRLTARDVKMLAEPFVFNDEELFMNKRREIYSNERFGFPKLLQLNLAMNKIKKLPTNFFKISDMSRLEWFVIRIIKYILKHFFFYYDMK